MLSEEIITSLREKNIREPICWLVCYKNRALQVIPPGKSGPHLMIFSSVSKAEGFIEGRKQYYEEEPLSLAGLDKAETLRELALAASNDPNYAGPPSGLVLDFDYGSASSRVVISPEQVVKWQHHKIREKLGLKPDETAEKSKPTPIGEKPAAGARKFNWKVLGLGCGAIGIIALLCVSLGAVLWLNDNRIPFLANNIETSTALPTATPTIISTVPPTPITGPHILVHAPEDDVEVLQDSFGDNSNGWKSYYQGRIASVVDGHIRVVSYDRGYVNVATCSRCGTFVENFYLQGDLVLSEFEPISYGLAFCINENNNYYVYTINHNSFEYALFKLIDDEWFTLIEETFSEEISGHPNTNTLSVYFENGNMELFINGVLVDSYRDPDPLSRGEIGFIVNGAGAELFADNLLAYQR